MDSKGYLVLISNELKQILLKIESKQSCLFQQAIGLLTSKLILANKPLHRKVNVDLSVLTI